jgi:hypothetical protein
MTKLYKNQSGISLVGILMGISMSAGIALVISNLTITSHKTQKNLEFSIETESVFAQIGRTLARNVHCVETFKGIIVPSDGTHIQLNAIKQKIEIDGQPDIINERYVIGDPSSLVAEEVFISKGSKLQIRSMEAFRNTTSTNKLSIKVQIEKPVVGRGRGANEALENDPINGIELNRTFEIDASFNLAGEVVKCFSQLDGTREVHCDSLGGDYSNSVDCVDTRGDCELRIRNYLMRGYPASKVICGQLYYPHSTI